MRRDGRAALRTEGQLLGLFVVMRTPLAGSRIRLPSFGNCHKLNPTKAQKVDGT
jgi:hypothetical protein